MNNKFDIAAEDEKRHRREQARERMMGNTEPVANPRQMPRSNEPNAGGQNRETGDRKARQNDRADDGENTEGGR